MKNDCPLKCDALIESTHNKNAWLRSGGEIGDLFKEISLLKNRIMILELEIYNAEKEKQKEN